MRLYPFILALSACVACSYADSVNVTFSGSISSSLIGGIASGDSFSGSFTYQTTAGVVFTGGNFVDFALAPGALTFTIDGNTVTNTGSGAFPDIVEIVSFGKLEIGGQSMAGTGPLNGGDVFVSFFGSANPAFQALSLPFPFPTDFTSTSVILDDSSLNSADAVLSSFVVTNTTNVPEPSSFGALSTVIVAAGIIRRRYVRSN